MVINKKNRLKAAQETSNNSISHDSKEIYMFSENMDKRIDRICIWICVLAVIYMLGQIVRWAI